jgi:hypothetical protein
VIVISGSRIPVLSENQRSFEIQWLLDPMMLRRHAGIEKVKTQRVLGFVNLAQQAVSENDPVFSFDFALKDRLLDTLPIVLAGPSYPSQAASTSIGGC